MGVDCEKISKEDPRAGGICVDLLESGLIKKDDETLKTPQDMYLKAIHLASSELRQIFQSLFVKPPCLPRQFEKIPLTCNYPKEGFSVSSALPQECGQQATIGSTPIAEMLKKHGMKLPFLLNDLNPNRQEDSVALKKLWEAKSSLSSAEDIYRFVSVRSEKTYGVVFDVNADSSTASSVDAISKRKGLCLSHINIYIAICKMLGEPYEVYDVWGDLRVAHVVIKIKGKVIDPEKGILKSLPPNSKKLTDLDVLEYDFYNRASSSECYSKVEKTSWFCKKRILLEGASYTGQNARTQIRLFQLDSLLGNINSAKEHLRQAWGNNPSYVSKILGE